jgi:hypothetical protein
MKNDHMIIKTVNEKVFRKRNNAMGKRTRYGRVMTKNVINAGFLCMIIGRANNQIQ